jgi:hypothetical protein
MILSSKRCLVPQCTAGCTNTKQGLRSRLERRTSCWGGMVEAEELYAAGQHARTRCAAVLSSGGGGKSERSERREKGCSPNDCARSVE